MFYQHTAATCCKQTDTQQAHFTHNKTRVNTNQGNEIHKNFSFVKLPRTMVQPLMVRPLIGVRKVSLAFVVKMCVFDSVCVWQATECIAVPTGSTLEEIILPFYLSLSLLSLLYCVGYEKCRTWKECCCQLCDHLKLCSFSPELSSH